MPIRYNCCLDGGVYSAKTRVSEVEKYNNFGLGGGVGIGEVITVNGDFYLANPNGKSSEMETKEELSYMTSANSNPQKSLTFHVGRNTSIMSLQRLILEKTENNQIMYAIKITGTSSSVLACSEDRDLDLQTPLVEWTQTYSINLTLRM